MSEISPTVSMVLGDARNTSRVDLNCTRPVAKDITGGLVHGVGVKVDIANCARAPKDLTRHLPCREGLARSGVMNSKDELKHRLSIG